LISRSIAHSYSCSQSPQETSDESERPYSFLPSLPNHLRPRCEWINTCDIDLSATIVHGSKSTAAWVSIQYKALVAWSASTNSGHHLQSITRNLAIVTWETLAASLASASATYVASVLADVAYTWMVVSVACLWCYCVFVWLLAKYVLHIARHTASPHGFLTEMMALRKEFAFILSFWSDAIRNVAIRCFTTMTALWIYVKLLVPFSLDAIRNAVSRCGRWIKMKASSPLPTVPTELPPVTTELPPITAELRPVTAESPPVTGRRRRGPMYIPREAPPATPGAPPRFQRTTKLVDDDIGL
jgi:hypothetical protein